MRDKPHREIERHAYRTRQAREAGGARGCGLPTVHVCARRRGDHRAPRQSRRGRSGSIQQLADGRRPLRPHAAATFNRGRRTTPATSPTPATRTFERHSTRHAAANALLMCSIAEGMGRAADESQGPPARHRRCRPQDRGSAPSDVGGQRRLPIWIGGTQARCLHAAASTNGAIQTAKRSVTCVDDATGEIKTELDPHVRLERRS